MMIKLWRAACLATVGVLALTGCGLVGDTKIVRASVPDSITVTSPAFRENGPIPVRFTCAADGGNGITPPLRWSVTDGTVRSIALVVDDPGSPGSGYVHWVLFNMDATADEILEHTVPLHSQQARNTGRTVGYTPPCPPKGEVHTYRFTVYALNNTVPLGNGAELKDVLAAIAKRTVARGRLTVKFGSK